MLDFTSLGVITAFAAGIISFLSPCVLPLVPGYLSYVAGHALTNRASGSVPLVRVHALALSLCFVLGFSTGLITIGMLHPWFLQRDFRFHVALPRGRPIAAYVLGMAFAFGWTPCIGPILGAILTVSAASGTIGNGIVLLAAYSLGLGVPFLVAAVFTDGLMARLKSFGRFGRMLQPVAGGVMVVMGIAMITGQLSTVSFWLLETFPALAIIG